MQRVENPLEREFVRYCVRKKYFTPLYEGRRKVYNPTGFWQLANRDGFLSAVKHCLWTTEEGFITLYELDRLDLTAEYAVLEAIEERPEFRELFTEEELKRARERLIRYGFDFKTKSVRTTRTRK